MKLSIIIVNYQSRSYLERCLQSIFAKINNACEFEVIVVNNGSEQELLGLAVLFPKLKIVQNQQNFGFGQANNVGAKIAQGEILFFLNPDTEIFSRDISIVLREFEENNNVGILGSQLLTENKEVQEWSAGREINLLQILKNNLGQREVLDEKKQALSWVSGTAMFVRKSLFEKLNGFDERFFMYFEDVDLCTRVRKLGKTVLYFPAFSAVHYGGKSYGEKRTQKKHYYESQDYYFQKHYGKGKLGLLKILRIITYVF